MHWKSRKAFRIKLLAVDPRCRYCARPLTVETSTLDHFQPRAAGGPDSRENLVLCCGPCNQRKGSRRPTRGALILDRAEV